MNNYGTEKKLRRQCIDASAAKDLLLFLLYPRSWQVAEKFFIKAEGRVFRPAEKDIRHPSPFPWGRGVTAKRWVRVRFTSGLKPALPPAA